MTPADMDFLAEVVLKRSGLVLGPDKGYLVESRLAPVARQEGFESLDALVASLRTQRDETLMWAVTDALMINETMFFRDKTPFAQFKDDILPALTRSRSTVRIWSAACSTGQEPYSLAMLLDELRPEYPKLKLDICASDISERVLQKAQTGVYSKFEVQRGLPIGRLIRHFEPVEDAWRIKSGLRQAVRWRTFNLLDDPRTLGVFDVVLCCNVLAWFDAPTRKRVLEQIAAVTAPDGFLLLGAAETVTGVADAFHAVPGRPGLYTRDPEFRRAA